MKAWAEARRMITESRNGALAERGGTPQDAATVLRWLRTRTDYKFSRNKRKCFFCGDGHRLTTGSLAIVGAVWKCEACHAQYDEIKGVRE